MYHFRELRTPNAADATHLPLATFCSHCKWRAITKMAARLVSALFG